MKIRPHFSYSHGVRVLLQVEKAIEQLSQAEFRELLRWMKERDAAVWDQQIKEDARSGRLETAYLRLMAEARTR